MAREMRSQRCSKEALYGISMDAGNRLVVGALAKLFMPGRDPGGVIVTMLIGLAGAALAGFLGRAVGWYNAGDAAGFIASILGAVCSWLSTARLSVELVEAVTSTTLHSSGLLSGLFGIHTR
jgi:uncharacterized membrane protein YeaQ/YmgE (transglycosylase-associated protein family)